MEKLWQNSQVILLTFLWILFCENIGALKEKMLQGYWKKKKSHIFIPTASCLAS